MWQNRKNRTGLYEWAQFISSTSPITALDEQKWNRRNLRNKRKYNAKIIYLKNLGLWDRRHERPKKNEWSF